MRTVSETQRLIAGHERQTQRNHRETLDSTLNTLLDALDALDDYAAAGNTLASDALRTLNIIPTKDLAGDARFRA